MNTPTTRDRPLLDASTATLQDLGFEVEIERHAARREGRPDATLTLQREGKSFRYEVEMKRGLRASVIGSVQLLFAANSEHRLLITDYIAPVLADELRRREIQFVDAAGNAFLKRRGLLIFISGRRSIVRTPAMKTLRVFRPSGLKTIFAMLSVSRLVDAPQRDIARAAGVALGSVAGVIDGLRELGFIANVRGSRRLLRRDQLVQQ